MTEVADLSIGTRHLEKWESAPLQFLKERMDRTMYRNRRDAKRQQGGYDKILYASQAEVNEGQDSESEQTFQMEMRAGHRNEGWAQIENRHHGNPHWNRGRDLKEGGKNHKECLRANFIPS